MTTMILLGITTRKQSQEHPSHHRTRATGNLILKFMESHPRQREMYPVSTGGEELAETPSIRRAPPLITLILGWKLPELVPSIKDPIGRADFQAILERAVDRLCRLARGLPPSRYRSKCTTSAEKGESRAARSLTDPELLLLEFMN